MQIEYEEKSVKNVDSLVDHMFAASEESSLIHRNFSKMQCRLQFMGMEQVLEEKMFRIPNKRKTIPEDVKTFVESNGFSFYGEGSKCLTAFVYPDEWERFEDEDELYEVQRFFCNEMAKVTGRYSEETNSLLFLIFHFDELTEEGGELVPCHIHILYYLKEGAPSFKQWQVIE